MRDMSEIARDYRGKGVEVLAVNVFESEESFRAFVAASGHDLRWVRADVKATSPFGFGSIPAELIVDRAGTVRWTSGLRSLFAPRREIRRQLDRLAGE